MSSFIVYCTYKEETFQRKQFGWIFQGKYFLFKDYRQMLSIFKHAIFNLVVVQDVDAVWYFHSREGSAFVEAASAVNVKRTWVDYGLGKFTNDSREVTKTDSMMFYITEIFLDN